MLSHVSRQLADVPNVRVNPKAGGLPGSTVLQSLIDGLAFWALLACLAAMIVGAVVWALAAHNNNHHYSANGRRGLLVAAVAALAVGASPALINFFAEAGDKGAVSAMDPTTRALLVVAATVAVLLFCLPTFLALGRDVAARTEVILLNLAVGWTGVGWIAALMLSLGPRRPRPTGPPPPTRPVPRPKGAACDISVYRDGVYLISSGPESHTWAIREQGRWQIVYELGGEERLIATVVEDDVPVSVLAGALETAEQ